MSPVQTLPANTAPQRNSVFSSGTSTVQWMGLCPLSTRTSLSLQARRRPSQVLPAPSLECHMTNRAFADFVARRLQERVGLLSYLAKPYLLAYAGFLAVFVALSFAIPLIHTVSMTARWPALGLVALIGALLPVVSRWRPLTTPHFLFVVFLCLLG